MLSEYIAKKLGEAKYEILGDGTYYGEIRPLRGVWANADTLEECRTQLKEVLEEWVLLKVRDGDRIPGFKLRVDRRALVKRA
jgi:predicted RNase H-like HicB family nuclease